MLLAVTVLVAAWLPKPEAPAFGCDQLVVGASTWGPCENSLGLLRGVRRGPEVKRQVTLEVRYSPSYGSGLNSELVSLVQKRGRHYRTLWTHPSIEVANGFESEHFARVYRWRFDARRSRILVSGIEKRGGDFDLNTGAGQAKSVRRLPLEAFCYSAHSRRFTRCEGSSA
jgi:hypothetical protein